MVRLPQLLAGLAATAAVAVAGCGGSDEPQGEKLPASVSTALLKQLDSVSDRVAADVAGACDDIYAPASEGGNIEPIDAALNSIPSDVDPEIRSALEQSIQRLEQLVDEECTEIRSAEQDSQDTTDETTPTETVTTETETVPTETTDTTPTPTETTPTTPVPPSEGGADGRGPTGDGPPGLDRGGAEAPEGGN